MKSARPGHTADALTSTDEAHSPGDVPRKVILIVEDEVAMSDLVSNVLASEGYSTHSATNGVEGLEQFYLVLADLIILDVKMPEMDGWETLKRLREISNCPVIMLTTFGSAEETVRALELGADDYIVKPFGTKELVARVRVLLRRSAPV